MENVPCGLGPARVGESDMGWCVLTFLSWQYVHRLALLKDPTNLGLQVILHLRGDGSYLCHNTLYINPWHISMGPHWLNESTAVYTQGNLQWPCNLRWLYISTTALWGEKRRHSPVEPPHSQDNIDDTYRGALLLSDAGQWTRTDGGVRSMPWVVLPVRSASGKNRTPEQVWHCCKCKR